MIWLWAGLALAGRWDGEDPDIQAHAVIHASPEAVYGVLSETDALERVLGDHCAADFDYGSRKDPEADVRLTYEMEGFSRRLDAKWSRLEPNRIVEIDHLGKKGFVTRFTLSEAEGGTRVEVLTPLNPPPWPFKRYFFTNVRPVWAQCYVDGLKELDTLAREATAEVEE